jgi:hypothetical protein
MVIDSSMDELDNSYYLPFLSRAEFLIDRGYITWTTDPVNLAKKLYERSEAHAKKNKDLGSEA